MYLSDVIYKATKKYKIPARIYTAILMQESNYRVGAIRKVKGHVKSTKAHYDKMYRGCNLLFEDDVKNEECRLRVNNVRVVREVATDYGMSQIHWKTVDRYKFNIEQLLVDEEYSINAGAEVLSWFHKRYSKREPSMWWTRYNCGTAKKVFRQTCLVYQVSVERWM